MSILMIFLKTKAVEKLKYRAEYIQRRLQEIGTKDAKFSRCIFSSIWYYNEIASLFAVG